MARRLRAVSLGDQLAEILRAQIVEGDLAAGTHLVEDTLASDHDVSRGPVRDAIKTLMAEGWLESRRRGFFVRELTATDITELYQIREAAEQLASALAQLVVWVHGGQPYERRRRGIERDIATEGRDRAEAEAFWDDWARHEDPFLAATRPWERAQLLVDGTSDPYGPMMVAEGIAPSP